MRQVLESQPNLHIKQAEVVDLVTETAPDGSGGKTLRGLRLRDGRTVLAGAVVITTGTFFERLNPLRRGNATLPDEAGNRPVFC